MPSFRRRNSVIDADRGEISASDAERATGAEHVEALVEEAEAEAAEAEAMAAAARARARAARLRRQAVEAETATAETVEACRPADVASLEPDIDDAAAHDETTVDDDTSAEDGVSTDDGANADDGVSTDDGASTEDEAVPATTRRRRIRRPGWRALAATVAVLGTLALLALSGWMLWKHQGVEKVRQQDAEYAAAARQSVVTLMSLDFTKAEEDVQRIIDNSTGQFKSDFESQAADFVKVAQDSKVITEVSVNSTAVESMSDQKAEVLVAASSRVTNTAGAQQEPRTWRLSVSLERDGDQIKMAKVEFVP